MINLFYDGRVDAEREQNIFGALVTRAAYTV